ncbi:hypothetical protein ABG067_002007 [Albugo candida]|uniref:Uncharacterized protein n=1 Tax=Albugo candida TaxID=65357 RepID=A0A024GNE7_9STRA|nr:unnamed protein product [Albugo candida]|eukprot:CCI47866.1 unnamed protein product [Albugo candida]
MVAETLNASPNKASRSSPSKFVIYTGFNDIKSSCGEQVDSRKVTAPYTVFGSSPRPKPSNGAKSPGPGSYQIPSTLGKAVLSTIQQAPSCSLSGRDKFGSAIDIKLAASSPGPGDYSSKVVNLREQNAPKFSLGKKWSSNADANKKVPGPGAYEASNSIGPTFLSTQKSNPASAFPRGERTPLTPNSTPDVGPGQYGVVVTSVGKQTISTLSTPASFSFGTQERSKTSKTKELDNAGQGRYYSARSSVGKQSESIYPSSPGISMSGRTKFGSHF